MTPVQRALLRIIACAAAIATAGCGGGSGLPMPLDTPSPFIPPSAIYAANTGSSTLTWYATPASGDIAPRNVISGSFTTGMFGPTYIFVDGAGMVWCSNAQPGNTNVSKYDPNAPPNTPPIIQLVGQRTLLGPPEGLAADAAGKLYVANGISNNILVFAPGAHGNAKPAAIIAGKLTGLNNPTGLWLDSSSDVYVTNGGGTFGGSVMEFAPGANGNVSPQRTIMGLDTKVVDPRGIALDALGQIYVATSSSVLVFAADSTGDAPPLRVISGSKTMLGSNGQIAVDAGGEIFVASGAKNALVEFAGGATGNTVPLQAIHGPSTQLNAPTGIAIR